MSWQVWDGDLFLFNVFTEFEADEHMEAGYEIVLETFSWR